MPEVTIEKQLGPSPSSGPFATVLKQADAMIAILTDSCDIYTRLWCVYEIFVAITLSVPVSLSSFQEITSSGGGSDAMYSNTILDSSGKPVVTSAANCGNASDKTMILSEIEKSGGFDLIDDTVMWSRIKALIDGFPNDEMLMETMMHRPIGSCSASNIGTRQNAGIANAIKVWKETRVNDRNTAKSSRKSRKSLLESQKSLQESVAFDIAKHHFCCLNIC